MTHPLTEYRRRHELTLEALGSMIGATKGMISKWESGTVLPRAKFMERIRSVTDNEVGANELLAAFSTLTSEAAE